MKKSYWICDICGDKFEEGHGLYDQLEQVYICVSRQTISNEFGGNDIFSVHYQDTCIHCRKTIVKTIEQTIENLENKKR